ncbi:hypothetical protein CCUS01_00258 [Colletotrichum cuscutae]|uniref:Uncharacterized protein n=1 Tax=Colletotrichum cuscutae TaxID=1209917 RepID=A0AAJ0DRG5_9PEZI|nr:hypothetical protein CCUS01_00258 [Colletotrichum cuscutae]
MPSLPLAPDAATETVDWAQRCRLRTCLGVLSGEVSASAGTKLSCRCPNPLVSRDLSTLGWGVFIGDDRRDQERGFLDWVLEWWRDLREVLGDDWRRGGIWDSGVL